MAWQSAFRRVIAAPRIQAALALVAAAATAFLWFNVAPDSAGLAVICVGLSAAPVVAPRNVFAGTCLAVSTILILLSVFGILLGLFLFLPSGVILLAVGLGVRHPPMRAAMGAAGLAVTLAVLVPSGLWVHHHFFPPSDILIVYESAPGAVAPIGLLRVVSSAKIPGLEVSTWTSSRELAVQSSTGILLARQRQRLVELVQAIPGVVTARWCVGTQCDG